MYQSILQFIENDIKEIENFTGDLLKGKSDTDDLSHLVLEKTTDLAAKLIGELYEKIDEEMRDCISRKIRYSIEKRNQPKELLDVMGTIRFHRTGYLDKEASAHVSASKQS